MKCPTSLSNVLNSSYSFHHPQQHLQLSHTLSAVGRMGQLMAFKLNPTCWALQQNTSFLTFSQLLIFMQLLGLSHL